MSLRGVQYGFTTTQADRGETVLGAGPSACSAYSGFSAAVRLLGRSDRAQDHTLTTHRVLAYSFYFNYRLIRSKNTHSRAHGTRRLRLASRSLGACRLARSNMYDYATTGVALAANPCERTNTETESAQAAETQVAALAPPRSRKARRGGAS